MHAKSHKFSDPNWQAHHHSDHILSAITRPVTFGCRERRLRLRTEEATRWCTCQEVRRTVADSAIYCDTNDANKWPTCKLPLMPKVQDRLHIPLCCCSVTQSCPTLCNPMDCCMPGLPVLLYLPEFVQIHVHWVDDGIQPSHPLSSPSPPALNPSQQSASFPMSWLFPPGSQYTAASDSASVLPMNIQDWFPLGLTGLISLLSKGLSRVFSSTTIQKHQFFSTQSSLWSNSHIHTWLLGES